MPTFIDESGDTGPAQEGGKPYFRLAAVWVPSHVEAEAFRARIREVRHEFGLRADYEFKFSRTHSSPERRAAFFRAALAQEFQFAVSSINKLENDWALAGRFDLYHACATDLAVSLRSVYHRSEEGAASPLREPIVVDDNEDKDFLAAIKQQFRGLGSRTRPGTSLIGKVSFRKSSPDEMLQLVDMLCDAAGAMIDGQDRSWFDMVADRHLP